MIDAFQIIGSLALILTGLAVLYLWRYDPATLIAAILGVQYISFALVRFLWYPLAVIDLETVLIVNGMVAVLFACTMMGYALRAHRER